MLYIALLALTWIPPVLGYGSLFRYSGDAALRRATTGMLGLAVLAALGTILHFLLPLHPFVSAAAWILGALLFWRNRRWLSEGASRWELLGGGLSLVAFVLLMQPPWRNYDAGLYYLQAVRWAGERSIEIGLVNLHGRLAYNSVWFLVGALLQHPLSGGASAFFLNLLPMTFTAAAASGAISRLVAGDRSFPNCAMAALVLPVAHASEGLGAQAPDQALTVLVPFALVHWARALEIEEEFAESARAAVVLSVLALMIKMSAAPLLAGGVVLLLAHRRSLTRSWRYSVAAVAMVGIVPWLARSVLLSGCLVYPVAATCVSGLRWTPAITAVQNEADWIYSFARQPGRRPDEVLGNWDWIWPWVEHTSRRLDYVSLLALIIAGTVGALLVIRTMSRSFVYTYGIAVGGVVFWFLSAPAPRFALGFLFALGLLPASFALSRVPLRTASSRVMVSVAMFAGAGWLVYASGVLRLAIARPWPIPSVTWPALPVTDASWRVTRAGYELAVPSEGDQCWNNPLPCSPYFNDRLGRDWALVDAAQLDP